MTLNREEIHDIAQSAASKVTVSERCKEIGGKLLNSREVLQTALDMAAHAKRPEDVVSSGLAKDMINLAKQLSRDVELTGDEAMRLEVCLASALDSVNKADYDTAISHILKARRGLLDLMFQEVVTCECGEAKAIEEKLGKEALRKILATKESTWICPKCSRVNEWYPYPTRCSRCGYLKESNPGNVVPIKWIGTALEPGSGEWLKEVAKGKFKVISTKRWQAEAETAYMELKAKGFKPTLYAVTDTWTTYYVTIPASAEGER